MGLKAIVNYPAKSTISRAVLGKHYPPVKTELVVN
jgi:hypothetical protein